jgi:alpha-1,3-rhamnosyl/mannosyltransferase
LLGIEAERVIVIPNALSSSFAGGVGPGVQARLRGLGVKSEYVLYVGTNKPWKNLEVAVRALQLASLEIEHCQLIIAGKQARNQEPLSKMLARVGAAERVTVLGTVSEQDLAALYGGAVAVLCPSIYEGFGFTALEAMACGAPVIHSGAASLPEVVGSTGIECDPHDPEAWARAITALWKDRSLRARVGQAGRERARSFTLERMVHGTVEVYEAVSRAG